MSKNTIYPFIVILLTFFGQGTSAATILFEDNFDIETLSLNYTNFTNWSVTNGTVDLIGQPSFFNFIPGHGRYVDLDGSSFNAGKMTSKDISLLSGRNYTLTFDLAGSQRSDLSNTVNYGLDLNSDGIIDIGGNQTFGSNTPFTTVNLLITANTSPSVANIIIENSGGDNFGLLLDNVQVSSTDIGNIPIPGALLLFSSALLSLLGSNQFRKSKN